MKTKIFSTKSFFLTVFYLVFFEFLSYLFLQNGFLGLSLDDINILYVALFHMLSVLLCCFWLLSFEFRENVYKVLVPILFNISIFIFLYFSISFLLNQFIILLSSLLLFFVFLNLEKEKIKFKFINATSFFSAFLFFFGMYSLIYSETVPYWLTLLFIVSFSSLFLYYKLKHIDAENNYRNLFLILFAIIITEVFLVSLFWPITSIFLKSLVLVVLYYLYWGILDMYLRSFMDKTNLIKYFSIFITIILLVMISLFIKSYF